VAENLRKPGGRIPNPDPNAPAGSTIERPPFTFGAKSQKRLLEAAELIRFYNTVGRTLTPANLQYNTVIKDFTEQWKALKTRKEGEDPEVPVISKALPIIKWTEAFDDFLNRAVGARTIPLAYVSRELVDPPDGLANRAIGKPHTLEHGSVEGDMIARASHTHALFRDDNATVYYFLEEATRGTPYAASLKPFQRTKNGRGALESIRKQYAGKDKWDAEIKRQDDLLHNRVWKGQSNFSLEKFVVQHRNAFDSMTQCAQHVQFQLPNEYTRVGYLLDAIQTSDAGLQAAIAAIRTDHGPTGKLNNFEDAATYLLPYCPVQKKRSANNKRDHENIISDVTADVSAGFGSKPGIGKSGVHLRYYTQSEYQKLTGDQKKELRAWRESGGGSKGKKDKGGKPTKTAKKDNSIAAAISKEVAKQLKKDSEEEDMDALIMSLQSNSAESANTDMPAPTPKKTRFEATSTTQVNTSALKSILRRVKNTGGK
jgi:hypothetical protein